MDIDSTSYRSVSFNPRVRFLILHYTAQNFANSIKSLTNNPVSTHYLIPNETDETYKAAGFDVMRIFNLVNENDRAWHAGESKWSTRTNLNDTSIGIEIVNEATDNNGIFHFPPFTEEQVRAVEELSHDIISRYPDITPSGVLGHSDIAPGRKSDPGAAFPWKRLFESGVGAWYDEAAKADYVDRFKNVLPPTDEIINKFQCYGYNTAQATTTKGLGDVVRAFQLHFRPENYNGRLDAETVGILYALVDKYVNKVSVVSKDA